MKGIITGRDVIRHSITILRLWGPGTYVRCLYAMLTRRSVTFLAGHPRGGPLPDVAASHGRPAPPRHRRAPRRRGPRARPRTSRRPSTSPPPSTPDNAEGLVYARAEQPTRRRLEAVLGALEGGEAVVYASGQAAATAALLHLRPRRVAIARGGYHGTHAAVDALAPLGVAKVPLEAAAREGRRGLARDAAEPHLRARGRGGARGARPRRRRGGGGGRHLRDARSCSARSSSARTSCCTR